MVHTLKAFQNLFKFNPDNAWKVGVERECFIVDSMGRPHPKAQYVLPKLHAISPRNMFTYELSACQLEGRTPPVALSKLIAELTEMRRLQDTVLKSLRLQSSYTEVGPIDMPLDIYPLPRYIEMVKSRSTEEVRAACRVIGTHVHVGMPDHERALKAYNLARSVIARLTHRGDKSKGERLKLYRSFAPDAEPPKFETWEEVYAYALTHGFASDPRKWWGLVRISIHGTIEFRMFGATKHEDEIVGWAKECREICLSVR